MSAVGPLSASRPEKQPRCFAWALSAPISWRGDSPDFWYPALDGTYYNLPIGGEWMDICMRRRDGRDIATAWANIRLSDSRQVGIGIDISNRKRIEQALQPDDMVARIFDMFVQLDRTSGHSFAGPGIGLTRVQSLVQLHDGQIEVKSVGPGRGSEFIVRLPMLANTTHDMECEDNGDETAVHLEGVRILVVDDNTDAADSLALLLELLGSDVLVAYDGASALELLERHTPDVIFLDLGMPVMDGYEVARRIRQSPDRAAVPLVAVSGWGQEEDLARTRDAGFDYHLVKPASVEALITILDKLGRRGTG